jgi:glycosyltransferase involved in cell wall biosynthesis
LEQVSDNGVYDAMNKAMHRASGEWLYFLGSDDELYACDVLGKMVDSSEAADGDVLYGSVLVDGPAVWATDGAIYDGSFDLSKLLSKNICHQAMFFRTSLVRSVGCFNTSYVVCADWDFNMRCWAKGQFKYVDLIVAIFHSGGISTQHQTDPDFESDVTRNVIHYFNLSSDDPLVTSPSFCGKKSNEARRASRVTPRRVLRSLAKRFGSGC